MDEHEGTRETTGPISYDNLKKANANGYYVNLYVNKKVEDTRVDAKGSC